MSDEYRKNNPNYGAPYYHRKATVYLPNSTRQVSAVLELNRLKEQLEAERAVNVAQMRDRLELEKQLKAQTARADGLSRDIKRMRDYMRGRHMTYCVVHKHGMSGSIVTEDRCTCGLTKALYGELKADEYMQEQKP